MTQPAVEQERPVRVCDVCYIVDDAPRHQIAHPIGAVPVDYEGLKTVLRYVDAQTDAGAKVLADFLDTSTQLRHLDCCRSVGCIDGTCDVVIDGAESLKDDELAAHLQDRTPDKVETVYVNGLPHGVVVDEILANAPAESQDPQVGPQNQEG
jgi:hypothetical protein